MGNPKASTIIVHFLLLEVAAAVCCLGFLPSRDFDQALVADEELSADQVQVTADSESGCTPSTLSEKLSEFGRVCPPSRKDFPLQCVQVDVSAGPISRLGLIALLLPHGPPSRPPVSYA